MPVVILSIEPYATSKPFAAELASALNLKLADLRPFERKLAERVACNGSGPLSSSTRHISKNSNWDMSTSDLSARVRELTLEIASEGDTLLVSWSAAATLHAAHDHMRLKRDVIIVGLHASHSHRAKAVQRRLCYPHLGTAVLELDAEDSLIAKFVTRVFDADWRHAGHYDVLIDTGYIAGPALTKILEAIAFTPAATESAPAPISSRT